MRTIEMYYQDNEKFADLINEQKYYGQAVLRADVLQDCNEDIMDLFDFDVPAVFKEDSKKVYILLLLKKRESFKDYELKASYCNRDLEGYYFKSAILTMVYVDNN